MLLAFNFLKIYICSETYSEPSQTSKVETFNHFPKKLHFLCVTRFRTSFFWCGKPFAVLESLKEKCYVIKRTDMSLIMLWCNACSSFSRFCNYVLLLFIEMKKNWWKNCSCFQKLNLSLAKGKHLPFKTYHFTANIKINL